MSARLSRFFAGTHPMQWLTEFPLGIVRACIRMLPRLRAEEAYAGFAINTGKLSDEGLKEFTQRWDAALRSAGEQPRPRANPQALAALGIGYRRVTKATDGQ